MTSPALLPRLLTTLALALLMAQPGWAQPGGPADADKKDYSPAEKILFMSKQLTGIKPPLTLNYSFKRSGTLEAGFDDKVHIALSRHADGNCCAAQGEFLSGDRRMILPDVPMAEGNPVTLYFLEREIREMNRLTKGSQSHFRKRIRMAVYQGATLREVSVLYKGRAVKGTEIEISPYADDPNRPRYEKLARKQFRFTLSPAVPGGVYGIRTLVIDADPAAPLLSEEMLIEGAEPGHRKTGS